MEFVVPMSKPVSYTHLCEGLDYQFCDCMVNYDLPWNPMKVEQRIGRIDRNGQTSESVAIYNMVTPGTVDADRCV